MIESEESRKKIEAAENNDNLEEFQVPQAESSAIDDNGNSSNIESETEEDIEKKSQNKTRKLARSIRSITLPQYY